MGIIIYYFPPFRLWIDRGQEGSRYLSLIEGPRPPSQLLYSSGSVPSLDCKTPNIRLSSRALSLCKGNWWIDKLTESEINNSIKNIKSVSLGMKIVENIEHLHSLTDKALTGSHCKNDRVNEMVKNFRLDWLKKDHLANVTKNWSYSPVSGIPVK